MSASQSVKITKTVVDQADLQRGRHYLWDKELRGFGVCIETTGTKTYFVRYQDPAHRYVVTRAELLDDICILMAGREAELLLLDDVSIGSVGDVQRATAIARALVEEFGLGGEGVPVRRFRDDRNGGRVDVSQAQMEALDQRIGAILEEGRRRAGKILHEQRALVEMLRDLLVERKTIDAKTLAAIIKGRQGDKVTR